MNRLLIYAGPLRSCKEFPHNIRSNGIFFFKKLNIGKEHYEIVYKLKKTDNINQPVK
jgi:hypothetical protein